MSSLKKLSFIFIVSQLTCLYAQQLPYLTKVSGSWFTFSIDAVDSNTAAVLTNTKKLAITTDGGLSWQTTEAPSMAYDISMIDKNHIWIAGTDLGIYYTSDGGASWAKQFKDSSKTHFLNFIKMFDAKKGVAQGDTKTDEYFDAQGNIRYPGPTLILTTSDGGKSWLPVNITAFGGGSGDLWRRLDFPTPDIGYFFTSGTNPQHMYKTQVGGAKWAELKGFSGFAQVLKFYNPEVGLAIDGAKVYRTTDAGYKWDTFFLPENKCGNDIEFVPGSPAKVFLTNGTSLFYSTDTARTLTRISIPMPNPPVSSLIIRDIVCTDKEHGWIYAEPGVYYKITIPKSVTVVNENRTAVISSCRITGNYPNPFNPSTVINYELAAESKVDMEVFDLTGRLISTLDRGIKPSGPYSAVFSGKDLSSGTYICRLRAAEISTGKVYTSSLKISLIK